MNKTVYKISFTGMMFALVLLFQFLEKFMPFGDFGFVKFNFSLVFILVTAAHIGMLEAFGLLALRFLFGPLLSGEGYAPMSVIGQVILLIVGLIVLFLFWALRSRHMKFTRKHKYIRLIIIVGVASMIMAFLNALIFTPWYLGAFGNASWESIGLQAAIKSYEGIKVFYFGIPDYWGGMFAVYTVFNIINLTITMLLAFPLLKISKLLANKN